VGSAAQRLYSQLYSARDQLWMDLGKCVTDPPKNPNLFYPPPGMNAREAVKFCQECPVRSLCLEYSIIARELYGVWGGVVEQDRRRMIRARELRRLA